MSMGWVQNPGVRPVMTQPERVRTSTGGTRGSGGVHVVLGGQTLV